MPPRARAQRRHLQEGLCADLVLVILIIPLFAHGHPGPCGAAGQPLLLHEAGMAPTVAEHLHPDKKVTAGAGGLVTDPGRLRDDLQHPVEVVCKVFGRCVLRWVCTPPQERGKEGGL